MEIGNIGLTEANAFLDLGIPLSRVSSSTSDASNTMSAGRTVVSTPGSLPFREESFDFVIADNLDIPDPSSKTTLQSLFRESRRVARRGALLLIEKSSGVDRVFLERLAFECGYRRHPGLLKLISYEHLQEDPDKIALLLEVIPKDLQLSWPLATLARERELHMDMSRESGSRSDAHLVRYHEAAALVRPGDVVLDAACGLGYGSWMLAATAAKRIVAIDRSEWAIEYANAAFQSEKISFQSGDLPDCLDTFSSNEFDLIVSFETLEHLPDPAAFLAVCERVLAPTGRIIVSVPNDWADDTGSDPNPHHFDVYDWPKLRSLLKDRFLLEGAYAQTADRAKVGGEWTPRGRGWTAIDPDSATATDPAEWLVVVGMKPFRTEQLPPWSREWHAAGHVVTPPPVDYARMLENPWLSRALLDRGSRLSNSQLLQRECEAILSSGGPFDRAAALVVLCYRDLETADRIGTRKLIDAVAHWRSEAPKAEEPHAVRWHVSLTFGAARLALKLGSFSEAETWFEACATIDAGLFSPLLLIKTVEAYYRLGLLRAADGRRKDALKAWKSGLNQAERVLSTPVQDNFGVDGTRLPFVFKEIGQICQWGQACADALEAPILYGMDEKFLPPWFLEYKPSSALISPARPPNENWNILRLSNANHWCEQVDDREFILHPSGLGFQDQPCLHVDVHASQLIRSVVVSAEAYNEDVKNRGVLLFIGPDGCADADLRCWYLPPREPTTVTHFIEYPSKTAYQMRILVTPVPNALSADYLGVRLRWIGTG